ncbi:MerR family transcriptional regulator [Nocardia sp. NPDC088792]|uniref:MerR family transcriptional regulator n=1 Tax=Nocardia sp. NPDC088792 TaxID=3364332 RepID=UPI00380D7956
MFSIGDFARFGRVSVRMLRHYDEIGLLTPMQVDPSTGYRFYAAGQLARLNRIVALKDLGFTLQQVADLLDGRLTADQLRGMLQLRRAQLANQVAADTVRLAGVEARLRRIESEGQMPENEIVVKTVPALVLAELTDIAPENGDAVLGPIIGRLYERLGKLIPEAGLTIAGPSLVYYEVIDEGLRVHVAHQVAGTPIAGTLDLLELPAGEAATLVHRGLLCDLPPACDAVGRWADENGYTATDPIREFYLVSSEDPASDQWVVEIQLPVQRQAV